MKKTNVGCKDTELYQVLQAQFGGVINLARVKLISFFVIALCKVQTVNFERLSFAFDTSSQPSSNLRRIQRFIAAFDLDADLIARFIFALLPQKTNLCLSIDRSNWKFGKLDINIFMLGITYKGLAFPLLFAMLRKRGNSHTQERIELIQRFICLFGKECIDCLVADREFVGDKWIDFLNREQIRYYIRIRNNFRVFVPEKGKEVKASWLFNHLKMGEYYIYPKIVRLGSQLCYLSGEKIIEKDKGKTFLIIVSFNKPEAGKEQYAKRWQIETCFRAMKTSGFNIEKTHLTQVDRIEKLLLLVMIAFIWCYKTGIYIDEYVRKVKIKAHGRKAKSLFKYGLDYICQVFLNPNKNKDRMEIFNFLSCT